MPFPQHWLLTFGGALINTGRQAEQWQCGLRGKPADASGYVMGQDEEPVLDKLVLGIKHWWTNPPNHTSDAATLAWIKLNEIGPNGKYVQSSTHVRDFAAVPGTTTSGLPSWLTVCYEWRTVKGRGPGSRGRIFPPLAVPPGSGDTITPAVQQLFLAGAKDLLNNVLTPLGTGGLTFAAGVASESDGSFTAVNRIEVGDRIEYISRRRNAVRPIYASTVFP